MNHADLYLFIADSWFTGCLYHTLLILFTNWWVFGLFLVFGYSKESCSVHLGQVFGHMFYYTQVREQEIVESYDEGMFNFISSCQSVFQSSCAILHPRW